MVGASAIHTGTVMPTEFSKTTLWQNRKELDLLLMDFTLTIFVSDKCFLLCLLIALGPFQFGFDNGIVAGFQAQPSFLLQFGIRLPSGALGIASTFQQLLASLPYLGQTLVAVLFGVASRYIGRLGMLRVSCVLCAVALFSQIFATNHGAIYAGRLILGGHNLANDMVALCYAGEAAPAHLRGTMGQTYQTFTGFGALIGAIVSNAYAKKTERSDYQTQLSLCFIIPTILFTASFFMPESPRWLMVKGRKEAGYRALARFRGNGPQAAYVEQELSIIEAAVEEEKKLSQGVAWLDIFQGSDLRRTLLSIACITIQSCTGNPLLTGYSTYFFKITGLTSPTPFQATIISKGCCGTVGGITGLIATRYFGRRTLLLVSYSISSICMLILAVTYTVQPTAPSTGRIILGVLCVFTFFFYGSMAPTSWVVGTEIPSNRLRSKTLAVAFVVGNISQWLVSFTAPYFINPLELNWGAKYGYIFCGTSLIAVAFIYFYIPEVRGRSLEEIDEMFQNKVSARKFSSYKTSSAEANQVTVDKQLEATGDSVLSPGDGWNKQKPVHLEA